MWGSEAWWKSKKSQFLRTLQSRGDERGSTYAECRWFSRPILPSWISIDRNEVLAPVEEKFKLSPLVKAFETLVTPLATETPSQTDILPLLPIPQLKPPSSLFVTSYHLAQLLRPTPKHQRPHYLQPNCPSQLFILMWPFNCLRRGSAGILLATSYNFSRCSPVGLKLDPISGFADLFEPVRTATRNPTGQSG